MDKLNIETEEKKTKETPFRATMEQQEKVKLRPILPLGMSMPQERDLERGLQAAKPGQVGSSTVRHQPGAPSERSNAARDLLERNEAIREASGASSSRHPVHTLPQRLISERSHVPFAPNHTPLDRVHARAEKNVHVLVSIDCQQLKGYN